MQKIFLPCPLITVTATAQTSGALPLKNRSPKKIQAKEGDINSVKYAAKRIDPEVVFTDEACAQLTKIPRVFLKAALTQMVSIAKEEGINVIDESALQIINDKRRKEKKG